MRMAPLPSLSALSVLAIHLLQHVSAEAGVVGLEFTKHEVAHLINPAFRLRKRADTASATIYNSQGDLLYLVNTTVGTPPQNIALQLDTGSSDIWLPWVGASVCEAGACTSGAYDDTKSSTFKEVAPDEFLISYVDGTKIGGDYINETFGIGGATVTQMMMGVAKTANVPGTDDSTPFQGIVGVGFDSGEAIVSQSRGQSMYPNIISQLVLQGKISTRAYSLWLNDLNAPSGNILFGGVDNAKFSGDLVILPLQNDTETGAIDTFTVPFAGLTILGNGGKTVYTSTTNAPVILDSGTTLTYLPNDIANAIANGVGATNTSEYGLIVPCAVGNTQGVFKFQFGSTNGPVITALISQFVLPFPAGTPSPRFKNGKTACRWGIMPADSSPNLFGDTFLRSAYVVYNIEGMQVGLAETKFNVSDTDIKQITAKSSLPGATSTVSGVAQQTVSGPIYPTSGQGGFASAAASTVAATATGTGAFDLGSATSSGSSSTGKPGHKGAAAGFSAPSTPFVGAIVAGISVIFAVISGSILILG